MWDYPEQKGITRNFLIATAIVATLLGVTSYTYWPSSDRAAILSTPSQLHKALCKEVPIRREWRMLTPEEKKNFTDSINCLSTIPSKLGLNGTVYDEFAALHSGIGSWCERPCFVF